VPGQQPQHQRAQRIAHVHAPDMRPPSVSTTCGVSLLLLARNSFAWRLPLL